MYYPPPLPLPLPRSLDYPSPFLRFPNTHLPFSPFPPSPSYYSPCIPSPSYYSPCIPSPSITSQTNYPFYSSKSNFLMKRMDEEGISKPRDKRSKDNFLVCIIKDILSMIHHTEFNTTMKMSTNCKNKYILYLSFNW